MSDIALNYGTYQRNATNSTSGSANGNTSTGNGSIWDSLFSNLGGILVGTGGLVQAIKTDPNTQAQAQSNAFAAMLGLQMQNGQYRPNNTIWIVLAVLVLGAVMFFAFMKK